MTQLQVDESKESHHGVTLQKPKDLHHEKFEARTLVDGSRNLHANQYAKQNLYFTSSKHRGISATRIVLTSSLYMHDRAVRIKLR